MAKRKKQTEPAIVADAPAPSPVPRANRKEPAKPVKQSHLAELAIAAITRKPNK